MATKFMTLDNVSKPDKLKRVTVFTHVLSVKTNEIGKTKYINEAEDTPYQWNNVLLIGSDKDYGDIFKVWFDEDENDFTIYFGTKGDEFDQ